MIEYTMYNSEGHFVMAKVTSETELPALSDGNVAVLGLHNIMTRLVDNSVVDFSDEEKSETAREEILNVTRSERKPLLKESDWIELPNCPLSDEGKTEWRSYRTALRDLPETADLSVDINDLVWPTKPE